VVVAEKRLKDFVVGVTNDDPAVTAPVYKRYRHVQYRGTLAPQATATMTVPASDDMFRYVIVQNQFRHNEAMCVADVQVYARRM